VAFSVFPYSSAIYCPNIYGPRKRQNIPSKNAENTQQDMKKTFSKSEN